MSNSSDELRWRVGRAKPERRADAAEATHRFEFTRTRCLALFSSDEKVPGTAPIDSRRRRNGWLRFHCAPEH